MRNEKLREEYIFYFNKMFPDAPAEQGIFIIDDAFRNRGKAICADDLNIHDKLYLTTLAFLRHQFYFKLHYGYRDKRKESNKKALEIMVSWGYDKSILNYFNLPEPKKMVRCPKCQNGCDFCLKGYVLKWVKLNYTSQLWFQHYE